MNALSYRWIHKGNMLSLNSLKLSIVTSNSGRLFHIFVVNGKNELAKVSVVIRGMV